MTAELLDGREVARLDRVRITRCAVCDRRLATRQHRSAARKIGTSTTLAGVLRVVLTDHARLVPFCTRCARMNFDEMAKRATEKPE